MSNLSKMIHINEFLPEKEQQEQIILKYINKNSLIKEAEKPDWQYRILLMNQYCILYQN